LSLSVSSQQSTMDKRKHSPEIPEFTFKTAPNSGAMLPLRALHSTSPLLRSAIAVPFAPVRIRAVSAIARSMVSGEYPPVAKALRKTVRSAVALQSWFASRPAELWDANGRRPWRSGSEAGGGGNWLISLES
jgi:hypothetical protein